MSSHEVHPKPTIELLPAMMAKDQLLVGEITDLVNQVYATAEGRAASKRATRIWHRYWQSRATSSCTTSR